MHIYMYIYRFPMSFPKNQRKQNPTKTVLFFVPYLTVVGVPFNVYWGGGDP